jgi:thiol-disulfide isomerase/thioredoxin
MPKLRPLAVIAGSAILALSAPSWGQTRDVDVILADLGGLSMPQFDGTKREDREYIDNFLKARGAYQEGRAALALELYKADPSHAETAKLMTERWTTLTRSGNIEDVLAETKEIASGDSTLAVDAAYAYAMAFGESTSWDLSQCMTAIDAFIAKSKGDERGANLLNSAARRATESKDQMTLYQRMVADFPDARASKYAPGKITQLNGVGKPFELSFQNAVDGETIDLASQKGTIFVIDYWATWCGPCIAEMPHMKELYAEYKGQGVEFIGVSLDQPEDQDGLKKLLAYVEENKVEWPQYYQGNGWASEFSTSWGINSIPALFVVDAAGNLHSTSARGQLEKMLPALIEQRDDKN